LERTPHGIVLVPYAIKVNSGHWELKNGEGNKVLSKEILSVKMPLQKNKRRITIKIWRRWREEKDGEKKGEENEERRRIIRRI
jgi:hypothetical protein